MKNSITITKQEFSNRFDGVLMNNSTIHTILSKETNLGFTTKLVTDQLKTELIESIFEDDATEETKTEVHNTEETIQEETTEEESAETENVEQTEDGLDELDDLDE